MARDRGELLKVDTPELEECDALYFYPSLTFDEGLAVLKCFDVESNSVQWDGLPDLLIKLARKENGAKAFPSAHREKILQWDFPTAMHIVESLSPIFESVAANLKKT